MEKTKALKKPGKHSENAHTQAIGLLVLVILSGEQSAGEYTYQGVKLYCLVGSCPILVLSGVLANPKVKVVQELLRIQEKNDNRDYNREFCCCSNTYYKKELCD